MTKKSVEKLQNAGYEFLRARDTEGKQGKMKYCIYISREFGMWKLLHAYETKKQRNEMLKMLDLQRLTIIDD